MRGFLFMPTEYKNHHIMKKNRLIRIEMSGGLCESCGKNGLQIHHKDLSKTNHSIDNLIFLCASCHQKLHSYKRGPQKYSVRSNDWFYKKFGVTRRALSEFCGQSYQVITYWGKSGKLDVFAIKEPNA